MEVLLRGNYRGFVRLDVSRAEPNTNVVVINVHGLYGLSGDSGSKSRVLGERILDEGLANMVQYSSSRHWSQYKDGDSLAQLRAFQHKTFLQEADDLRDTIDLLLDQSEDLFGIDSERLRFTLIANSIGGTVVSTLNDRFRYVDRIILCGSGLGSRSPGRPILSSSPSETEILESARAFRGLVLLVQGSRDVVVPLDAQDRLLAGYKNAKTQKIVIAGADHSFTTIAGKNTRASQQQFTDVILDALRRTSSSGGLLRGRSLETPALKEARSVAGRI